MIAAVDEFILYDDMQYTRRDWRNRNRIKTPQGVQWLTVPVKVKSRYHQKIRETEINDSDWATTHWKTLMQNYRRARYYKEIAEWLEPIYLAKPYTHISQLNRRLIEAICDFLDIRTVISNSWDYKLIEGKTECLAELCTQAVATEYVSGPAARNYIDEEIFSQRGIKVTWFDYSDYSEYPQLWGEFTHEVTILDILFNCGTDASRYMKNVHF